jgi:hypothetical protein
MPLASTTSYIKSLLSGLPMPGGLPNMACYINPPDPNDEANIPTSYVWAPDFDESRTEEQGGSIPRNTGPQTPSGFKPIEHMIEIFIVYFQANDDPQADTLFFGVVDAVMAQLRTSPELVGGVPVTDPYTGEQSALFGVGEVMRGRTTISAVGDQAWNRLDALLTVTVHELIQA